MENEQNTYNGYENANSYATEEYETVDPYGYEPVTPQPQQQNGMDVASMVLGIVALFTNPMSICSILAITFGIIRLNQKTDRKGMALTGVILGAVAVVGHMIVDTLVSALSMGLGSILYFC